LITGLVTKAGLPASLGYLVYVGEVVAPLILLFGLWARVGASIIAINMTDAIVLVHTGDFMKLNQTGGWELELQAMFLATAMAAALFGPGATVFKEFAVDGIDSQNVDHNGAVSYNERSTGTRYGASTAVSTPFNPMPSTAKAAAEGLT